MKYTGYEINADGTGLKQLTGLGEDAPLTLPPGVAPSEDDGWKMGSSGNRVPEK